MCSQDHRENHNVSYHCKNFFYRLCDIGCTGSGEAVPGAGNIRAVQEEGAWDYLCVLQQARNIQDDGMTLSLNGFFGSQVYSRYTVGNRLGGVKAVDGKVYEYESLIYEAGETGGAYVLFPYDIRKEFGRGRVKVHATFDGEPYDGSIVNMGVRNADGSVCYIIGVRKDIRSRIGKQPGDSVRVKVRVRE